MISEKLKHLYSLRYSINLDKKSLSLSDSKFTTINIMGFYWSIIWMIVIGVVGYLASIPFPSKLLFVAVFILPYAFHWGLYYTKPEIFEQALTKIEYKRKDVFILNASSILLQVTLVIILWFYVVSISPYAPQ